MEINKQEEAEALFNQGHTADEIIQRIIHPEMNEDMLEELKSYLRQLKFRKQRSIGFKCLIFGAMLCLTSCVLTFFHSYSEMYTVFTLYGLTLIGACLLLIGLSLVLGL